jgi:Fur family transcriptional regulator, iron response regulator
MKVMREVMDVLKSRGIQPSAQRVAVAQQVLAAHDHPGADEVFARVRKKFPMVSRATVYNTLNVLVEKGLLRALVIAEGKVVFDPKTDAHHHFIDEATGAIHDVAWDAIQVSDVSGLPGLDVREYQVVLRGRRRKPSR